MERGITRFGLYTMAVLAVGVALHAMRYDAVPANIWLGVDSGIRGVIQRVPVQALTHMLVAPFALLLGPFQFMPRLRARYPKFHRWSGRVYVAACLIAGLGALATAPYSSGGPIAGIGFALLAVSWLGTTFAAWRAAVARRFELHRLLMRFSYAMTFGAVTLRLQIPFGFIFFGFHSYSAMSVWLAYTSWIPNVIVVALYSAALAWRRSAARPAAA
ncbi:MAG TPA: DUF2306 domain-containing protein [Rhizomicrobium sp.]|jgi:hypothetical protein|nr:DUF2306 domain-containing protein [Rhizomicrobium sp.]